MARADTLAILGEIVDRLAPIGGVGRGTPLRSDDWNVMVEALAGLARLIAAREATLGAQLEQGYAPLGHCHAGEASLGWFEPATRALLEAAATGSAEQRIGQQRIEAQLGTLRADMKALRAEMEGLRQAVDGLRDADAARAGAQGRLARDVETLRGVERGVSGLSARLADLDGSVETVLAFRDQLRDDAGNPVDFRAIEGRVAGLEEIGRNLRTASGEIVRIREIESAIARLEAGSVGRAEVDGLIADRVRDGGFLDDPALLDRIAGRVEATVDPRLSGLAAEVAGVRNGLGTVQTALLPLRAGLDAAAERLSAQDARQQGLAALAPRLDRAEAHLATAEQGVAGLRAVTDRVPALAQSVAALEGRVAGFDATVTQSAANAATLRGLATRTAALETATAPLGALPGRVAALEAGLGRIDGFGTRVGAVERGLGDMGARLEATESQLRPIEGLPARLDRLESRSAGLEQWRSVTDTRLAQLASGGDGALGRRVAALEERVADQGATITRIDRRVGDLVIVRGDGPILR